MIRFILTISEEFGNRLAAESKKKGITIQALVRLIIADYLNK